MAPKHCFMKQYQFHFILLLCCSYVSTSAQFYKFFSKLSSLETESGAIELNDGFVFGFTETNPHKNFHENILLIKTSERGGIVWSKRYDAGNGISLHLIEMIHTADDKILISGITGPDNNFNGSNRCILLLDEKGNIAWANKYFPGYAFDYRGLVQLQNSSFVFSVMADGTYPSV